MFSLPFFANSVQSLNITNSTGMESLTTNTAEYICMRIPFRMGFPTRIWYPSVEQMIDFATYIFYSLISLAETRANALFAFIFIFRYLRLVVHIISFYFLYKPAPIPANPTLTPADVTIIIPTIDPENDGFKECLQSTLKNHPGHILIVTVGNAKVKLIKQVIKPYGKSWPSTTISVTQTPQANKRKQVCHALPLVSTAITVLVDDHVYWPSANFLPTILAPFEDPQVGGLGTNKVVRRTGSGYGMNSVFNFLGCVYLERHNFEIAATNAIDGGVFVLSGRTSAYRSCILKDQDFLNKFSNEMFWFGKLGPINPDDDNCLTRWLVTHGWKLKIQFCPDATIETDLGNPGKYLPQCLRWVRTTWRSNSCSLFTDRTVWRAQPWCVYAVYITSFFNFALFYDAALLLTLRQTTFGTTTKALTIMAAIILASKMVKLIPHFRRCPWDILLIPAYLIFAYVHSLYKLFALFTFYKVNWGGRNLAAVDASAQDNNNDSDDDRDDSDDSDNSHRKIKSNHSSTSAYSTGVSYRPMPPAPGPPNNSFPPSTHHANPGRQAVFNRFFDSDEKPQLPASASKPALSSYGGSSYASASYGGSSYASASYGTSQYAAWEKASFPQREAYMAAPIAIPNDAPRAFPAAARPLPHSASKYQRETESVLTPQAGHNPSKSRYGQSMNGLGHRSPIYTRGYASSSGSSSSSASAYTATSSPNHTGPWPCEDAYTGTRMSEKLPQFRAQTEYRRSWERGTDCGRQHDEGMDLVWGECGLPEKVSEMGL